MMAAMANDGIALSTLLAGICTVPAQFDRTITGLALDSRRVVPGDCFFALEGTAAHGVTFARAAVAAGARVVLVEDVDVLPALDVPVLKVEGLGAQVGVVASRFFGAPSAALDVAAITGTNGKTTVAHVAAQALSLLGARCAYLGTLGYGLLDALAPAGMTTPDPISFQRELARALREGCVAVACEASSHALTQDRLAGTAIDFAVLTGFGHDHLDYHATSADYAAAKKRLFTAPGISHAILNCDSALGREIAATLPDALTLWTYGLAPQTSVPAHARRLWAESIEASPAGTRIALATPFGRGHIASRLLGDFNVENTLAVLGILLARGTPLVDACAVLGEIRPVPGRMDTFGGGSAPLVVVDYAHSPDSLARVLTTLRAAQPAALSCVFGCGGDRDRTKRPLMGELAERLADRVIVTADNPRSEDNADIAREILQGMRKPAAVRVIHDREAAIRTAIAEAAPGEIVLVAGKGHEREQVVGGEVRAFSDQAVVAAALAERGHD